MKLIEYFYRVKILFSVLVLAAKETPTATLPG